MVVINRGANILEIPPRAEPYARGAMIGSPGDEFRVFGMAFFEGVSMYLIFQTTGVPGWIPSWLFVVKDGTLPSHWICNSFPDWPDVLIAPPFIAANQDSYRRMVELEADMVEMLYKEISETDS